MALLFPACSGNGPDLPAASADSSPPALGPDFMRGVSYAHIHRDGRGYGSAASEETMGKLHAIGVRWSAITSFGYQESSTADHLQGFPGREGPSEFFTSTDLSMSDSHLIREIETAHRLGVKVVMKPHIWSRDFWDGKEWHGTVRQNSAEEHASWWSSYRAFIRHYAELAEKTGAEALVIGTELETITRQHPDEWRALARELRGIYSGKLSYAAHWSEEFEVIRWWDELDFVGICAYYPLDAPADADIAALVAAWAPHKKRIEAVAHREAKPVVFLEAGYRRADASWREPWSYSGGNGDNAAQAKAMEALFITFADEPWWQGVFWWKVFTDPKLAEARGDGTDFRFIGFPAEEVVRRWYR